MFPYIEKIVDYTIPFYGNRRLFPYATLYICDGKNRRIIKTEEDVNGSYFIFNRKKYRVVNHGSLYNPKLQVAECQ